MSPGLYHKCQVLYRQVLSKAPLPREVRFIEVHVRLVSEVSSNAPLRTVDSLSVVLDVSSRAVVFFSAQPTLSVLFSSQCMSVW